MVTPIYQSGVTTADQPVMAGAGKMMTTHGVPLEVVLAGFNERGWVCDWVDYCQTCVGDGHNVQTILARVTAACADVYGPVHAETIRERLEMFFETLK